MTIEKQMTRVDRQKLAFQVNIRREAKGKEPLRLMHIERVMRFVFGPVPQDREVMAWFSRPLRCGTRSSEQIAAAMQYRMPTRGRRAYP